jgi:flagellar basal-body rod modification protein FlgD
MSSISPINATSTAPAPTTGTDSLTDPNTFLKLLVAELKYQDPLNPADPNQYLAQTAQFSMVEKINDLDTQLTAMNKASQEAAAAALIGRQVVGTTATGDAVTGAVSAVQASSSGVDLLVGGKDVPMGSVTSITEATSAATTATAPATPTTSTTPTNPTTSTTPTTSSTSSTSSTDDTSGPATTSTTPATTPTQA